jgi:hypothetical protein
MGCCSLARDRVCGGPARRVGAAAPANGRCASRGDLRRGRHPRPLPGPFASYHVLPGHHHVDVVVEGIAGLRRVIAKCCMTAAHSGGELLEYKAAWLCWWGKGLVCSLLP